METVDYEGPEYTHHVEDVTDDNQEPPLEIDLTQGDVLVINEEMLVNPSDSDNTEENEVVNIKEVAPDTPQSRGRKTMMMRQTMTPSIPGITTETTPP